MPPDNLDVRLDETDARRVLLLQCVETAPPSPLWSDEDRRWAGRAASQALGDDASRGRWIVERARLALQRLAPRDRALSGVLDSTPSWTAWSLGAIGAGALVGLLSDALLAGPYVNLLSLPFHGLLAWNLALYAVLAWRRMLRHEATGPVRGWLVRRLRAAASDPVLGNFAVRWAAASQDLTAARAARLMHLAGAALALGLIAGMYARALVFDFRAGWATTLLDAGSVHALLAVVFAPAQALSGIALPDTAGIDALRVTPGAAAWASAAPWLHLMALTLGLVVLLPRLVLAALAGARAARLARDFALPMTGLYFDRLHPQASRSGVTLQVVPHGQAPTAQTTERLDRWMRQVLGADLVMVMAETVSYGEEENVPVSAPTGRALVLFDLAATPEHEVHGRLLRALPGRPVLLVDETEFQRRFGTAERLTQRRAAWAALAAAHDVPLVSVNLERPDEASAAALRSALER